jgi:hypothetical protein
MQEPIIGYYKSLDERDTSILEVNREVSIWLLLEDDLNEKL